MTLARERAALVLLLKTATGPWTTYTEAVEQRGSAVAVLEEQRGIFADDGIDDAIAEIAGWERRGIRVRSVLDLDYPENLRTVHDRPPLMFVAGSLEPSDSRSVAVVGTRAASPEGLSRARAIAEHLVAGGYTVMSGLAAGVDTAAHTAALRAGGRTVAVLGTGIERCYPPQNRELQRRIASECGVASQFWPDSPPSQRSFPMRNAVMSGLALGTVVVEASHTSGARTQARRALEHGRPVFLPECLLEQKWAREYARLPGTHVVQDWAEITAAIERLNSSGALVS